MEHLTPWLTPVHRVTIKRLGETWDGLALIFFSPCLPAHHHPSFPFPVPTPMTTAATLKRGLISQLVNIISGLPLLFISQPVSLKRTRTHFLRMQSANARPLRLVDVKSVDELRVKLQRWKKQKHISCLLLPRAALKDGDCSRSNWPAT